MTSTNFTHDLIDRAYDAGLNLARPSNVARFLKNATGEAIGTFDRIVSDFVSAAAPVFQERRATAAGALFKATTRRAKAKNGFEGTVIDAAPRAEIVDDVEGEKPYWIVHVPAVNGFASGYSSMGGYDTEAEALEAGLRAMLNAGWRRTRVEAVADMEAAIVARKRKS